jgi:Protein of unknown function (DUF2442)
MTIIKAKKYQEEPVTPSVKARAVAAGRKRQVVTLQAKQVRYLPEFKSLAVGFADKVAILLPIKKYTEFTHLTLEQLSRIEIGFGGSALCLNECNLHVSIAGLVSASKPLMQLASTVVATRNGSRTSEAKSQASRMNGQKGGRPKKLDAGV